MEKAEDNRKVPGTNLSGCEVKLYFTVSHTHTQKIYPRFGKTPTIYIGEL